MKAITGKAGNKTDVGGWGVSSIGPTNDGMLKVTGFDGKWDGHGAINLGLFLIQSGRECLAEAESQQARRQNRAHNGGS